MNRKEHYFRSESGPAWLGWWMIIGGCTIVLMTLLLSGCNGKIVIDPCQLAPDLPQCQTAPKPDEPKPTDPGKPTDPPTAPVDTPQDRPEYAIPFSIKWVRDEVPQPAEHQYVVNQAIHIEYPKCEATGPATGPDCAYGEPREVVIQKLAKRLRSGQLGQVYADINEPGGDALVVGYNLHRVQSYHVYNDGGGKVVWGSYRDTWRAVEEPPIVSGPDTTLFPQKPVTRVKVKKVGAARGLGVFDATAQTGPDRAFCISIGKEQDYCPLGPECLAPGEPSENPADVPDPKCLAKRELRAYYETQAGPWIWAIAGQVCAVYDRDKKVREDPRRCFFANDAEPNPFQVVVMEPGELTIQAGNEVRGTIVVNP